MHLKVDLKQIRPNIYVIRNPFTGALMIVRR